MGPNDKSALMGCMAMVVLIVLLCCLFSLLKPKLNNITIGPEMSSVKKAPIVAMTATPAPTNNYVIAPTIDKAVDVAMTRTESIVKSIIGGIVAIVVIMTCATVAIVVIKNAPDPTSVKERIFELWYKIENGERSLHERDIVLQGKQAVVDNSIQVMKAKTAVIEAESRSQVRKYDLDHIKEK